MSDILDAAKRFKTDLINADEAALRQLEDAYTESWKRLQEQLTDLTQIIADAQAEGIDVAADHVSWLYRQQRYTQLIDQLEQEMGQLASYSARNISEQQRKLLEMGASHAEQLTLTGLGPVPQELVQMGLTVTWNRAPLEATQAMIGFLRDGSPLEYKFAGLVDEISKGIKTELIDGITQGLNPREIHRRIRKQYESALANSLTTCRTEALRAYRTASHESYRANSDIVSGWIWSCAHSAATCAACWGMDGTFHPLTEEFGDHPNGRCTAIPKTKSWAELFPQVNISGVEETSAQPWDSEDYFKKLSDEQQQRVLGSARYEAYKNGDLSLRDIPQRQESQTWGDHYRVGTLEELGLKRGSDGKTEES